MTSGDSADWRRDRVAAAREGRNPTVLARLDTGWVVIGDHQRLPGYCVLIHDGPADHLTDVSRARGAPARHARRRAYEPDETGRVTLVR